MGEIVYEVHGEDHREGWWSELKGEQKSQGQSFEGSVHGCHFAQNWNNDMLCSILKYAGFLKIYFTLYFNPTILIIMNMF